MREGAMNEGVIEDAALVEALLLEYDLAGLGPEQRTTPAWGTGVGISRDRADDFRNLVGSETLPRG